MIVNIPSPSLRHAVRTARPACDVCADGFEGCRGRGGRRELLIFEGMTHEWKAVSGESSLRGAQ